MHSRDPLVLRDAQPRSVLSVICSNLAQTIQPQKNCRHNKGLILHSIGTHNTGNETIIFCNKFDQTCGNFQFGLIKETIEILPLLRKCQSLRAKMTLTV